MTRRTASGAAALLLVLLAAGCSRSPRVSFYTLAPEAKLQVAAPERQLPVVAVGPVTLPELVDRPQFVVRVAENRVEILESHRWAEPLKSEIPRLIAVNLGRTLGSTRVSSYRQHAGRNADYRVLIDIIRFESADGAVTVESNWSIRRAVGGAARTGRSLSREKVSGVGYDALVAAYSRALAGVSADLAEAIKKEDAAGK